MDPTLVSVALIRKFDSQGIRWLGRWNSSTETLRFVMAQPLPGESLRESITREVAWEFELDRKSDFLVSNMAQLNVSFPESLPAVADQVPLSVSFYNVELYRRSIRQQLNDDLRNHWLTSEEIWSGRTPTGLSLDPLVHQMITGSQVIQHWESSR